jgi:hypothetical protein
MPTKRRFILFLIVLAVMLLLRLARSQDAAVGWAPDPVSYGSSIARDAATAALLGVVFGIVAGGFRVAARQFAAREDRYFTGDLVTLRLPRPTPPPAS